MNDNCIGSTFWGCPVLSKILIYFFTVAFVLSIIIRSLIHYIVISILDRQDRVFQ